MCPPQEALIRLFFRKQAKPIPLPPDVEPSGPVAVAPTGGDSFAAVLEAQGPDVEPLAEAYDYVREHMPKADNIGRTGDERDYYTHLDKLSEGVSKTFPQSFCRAGCSSCCHYPVGLFTITFTEWQVIRRHIETEWTEAQRRDLAKRYRATFTWFWTMVLGYLQGSMAALLVTAPVVQRKKIACPFLVDNRCSVYAARPYQCRTFGSFSARAWPFKQPKVYACNEQGENLLQLLARSGPQFQLPVMNPIVLKIRALCRGPRLSIPLWVGAWVRRYEKTLSASVSD